MKVIIGCECSGIIRDAFSAKGHDAWSCDLKPSEKPGQHYQMDVFQAVELQPWDLGIFHPECKRLANSGVLRLYKHGKKANGVDPEKWQEMVEASNFFLRIWWLPIPKLCIENSIQHCHAKKIIGAEQSQTIQPWEHGEPESKRTCLWLRGLPMLTPTNILPLPDCGHWRNQTRSGQNKLSPSPHRAADRARTYPGIAKAMAEQWG